MSAGTIERPPATKAPNGNDSDALIVRPQTTIGVAAEQQRVQAEIQSRLMVAKSCPRDEVEAIDRIKVACQRPGLAENSEYSYSRGGTEISGPTIDLLRVIANAWGNIDYGFRELSQGNGESTIECFAWDLETNSKNTKVFTQPHKRYTKTGTYPLTDPRDIYEMVANNAERRVRACLESIIPPDVVDDAVAQCRETMKAKTPVTPETIGSLLAAFAKHGVTKEQVEKRLQRRVDTMQPAQMVALKRIGKSIADGLSKPADWFESTEAEQPPKTATESAKDALRKPAAAPPAEPEPPNADDAEFLADAFKGQAREAIQAETTELAVIRVRDQFREKCTTDDERKAIDEIADAQVKKVKGKK